MATAQLVGLSADMLTLGNTGYSGDPNSAVIAIINDADIGTWFIDDATDDLWQKKDQSDPLSWVFYDTGPLGGATAAVDIDFVASSSEDVVVPISLQPRELIQGRLYVDEDPGAGFAQWATFTFYNKAAKHGSEVLYRAEAKLVYTELQDATPGGSPNIKPDDHLDFSPNNLAIILDTSDEEIRLATIAATMIAEDNIGAHPIGAGLVRVSEFSGFALWNDESGSDVYLRIEFASAQTVSLHMELVFRR